MKAIAYQKFGNTDVLQTVEETTPALRSGKVKHLDSEGHSDIISNQKLMMMNAGSTFFHDERVLEEGGVL